MRSHNLPEQMHVALLVRFFQCRRWRIAFIHVAIIAEVIDNVKYIGGLNESKMSSRLPKPWTGNLSYCH
jgi:hypothetical protein